MNENRRIFYAEADSDMNLNHPLPDCLAPYAALGVADLQLNHETF